MATDSIYKTPQSSLTQPSQTQIFRHKRCVVLDKTAELPERCFKCNEPSTYRKDINLVYLNPWIYLTLLITPIVTIILGLIFQKKFTLSLPLCEAHQNKRKRFVIIQWAMVAAMIALIVAGIALTSDVLLVLAILLLLIVVLSALGGRQMIVSKVKGNQLWVGKPGKPFLESLPLLDK